MAVITISRGTFFGSCKLADCLSKKLGYSIIDRESILEKASKTYGLEMETLVKSIEGPLGFFDYIQPVHKVNFRFQYLAFFQSILCEEAKKNSIIYTGHAGHLLLKGISHVIKIKVIADFEKRIEFLMEEKKFSREESIKYINNIDKQRKEWTKMLYELDWNDPHLYDLVVKLKKLSIETACDMIALMANSSDFAATEKSIKAINDLALESKARAIILSKYPKYNYDEIKITANSGELKVGLKTKNKEDEDNIREALTKIEEAKKIICFCDEESAYEDISHLYSPW
jgi:cytidylate kinase